MKLVCIYQKPLTGTQRLYPRDIRNYINSVIPNDYKELKDFFAWHEHSTSPVIYTMPNRKSFAIISYDKRANKYFTQLQEFIYNSSSLSFKNGIINNIKECFTAKYNYTRFEHGVIERKMRTPLVIASSKEDYAKARELSSGDSIDIKALEDLTRDAILQSLIKTNKDWFDRELDFVEDILLLFKDLEYHPIKYKENQWYPAVRATIISNLELPDFIGYKIGLGYGELMRIKEMQKRGIK